MRSYDSITRDYETVTLRAIRALRAAGASAAADQRASRMQIVVDEIWDALAPTGVSWVGFYSGDDAARAAAAGENRGQPAGQLILGPRRDKPACSPIGLHGACGRCFLSGRPLIVRDVRDLGANYIACDPRDRSEVVVPCRGSDGVCWGVLDLDSHEIGAFDERDVTGLEHLLQAVHLSHPLR